MFRYWLALAFILSLHLPAKAGWVLDWCRITLAATQFKLSQPPKLTHTQAAKILMGHTIYRQARLAIDHVFQHRHEYANADQMTADLALLFEIVSANATGTKIPWSYVTVPGPNGSYVFVGSAGHFTAVTRDKKIQKGFAARKDFEDDGTWKGTAMTLFEVKAFEPVTDQTLPKIFEASSDPDMMAQNALIYVTKQIYSSPKEILSDLEKLYGYIHKINPPAIREKFFSDHGEVGFVGKSGYFVMVHPSGSVFEGQMDKAKDLHGNRWDGSYLKIEKVEWQ